MPDSFLDIFEASLANSTHKQYAGSLRQWWSHCLVQDIDPYHPEESNVIEFLSEKFKGTFPGSSKEYSCLDLLNPSTIELGTLI